MSNHQLTARTITRFLKLGRLGNRPKGCAGLVNLKSSRTPGSWDFSSCEVARFPTWEPGRILATIKAVARRIKDGELELGIGNQSVVIHCHLNSLRPPLPDVDQVRPHPCVVRMRPEGYPKYRRIPFRRIPAPSRCGQDGDLGSIVVESAPGTFRMSLIGSEGL